MQSHQKAFFLLTQDIDNSAHFAFNSDRNSKASQNNLFIRQMEKMHENVVILMFANALNFMHA